MKIALIGNQNSGKTTLFNALTGSNQKVGNWPGVTIERKEGKIKGTDLTIVDLPGVYSLSPYTPEEEVSRQYAIEEKPDLIINIIDASCIERSLYLTTQLLELDSDVIVALNMSDTLEKKGITIDVDKLSALLMTSVIKVSALKGTGINELLELLVNKSYIKNEHKQIFPKKIEDIIELSNIHGSHKRFVSVKMIENDPCYFKLKSEEVARNVKSLELQYGYDIEQIIANERYNYIDNIKKDCVIEEEKGNTITDKLDKIFLNKWASIPIFAIIMAAIYILAVGVVGGATVDLVSNAIDSLKNIVENCMKL